VGVDMGRNIFQSEHPVGMIKAVRGIVHENMSVNDAYDLFNAIKSGKKE
jgi:putative autoinducer-2 (AI-2) aldolase